MKNSPSPHVIIFCLIGTHRSKKKKVEQQSLSLNLVRRPPLSRPPRHRFGPGKLSSLSDTVSPVVRLACSPVLTVAVVRQLDNVGAQTE